MENDEANKNKIVKEVVEEELSDFMYVLSLFDEQLLKLRLTQPTIKIKDLCEQLDCSYARVSKSLSKPIMRAKMEESRNSAMQLIMAHQTEAVELITDTFKDKDEDIKVRVDAAKYVTKSLMAEKVELSGTIHQNVTTQKVSEMSKQEKVDYMEKLLKDK